MHTSRRLVIVFLLLLTCLSSRAAAYAEMETHFTFTMLLARESCFSGLESFIIAWGDVGTDFDNRFVAGFNSPTNTQFHAFGNDATFALNSGRNWDIVLSTSDEQQLAAMGVYLHGIQDRFSHKGYDVTIGHSFDTILGSDPDSLVSGSGKKTAGSTQRMALATLTELERLCSELGRPLPGGHAPQDIVNKPSFQALLQGLENQSDASWKFLSFVPSPGSLLPRGKEVQLANINLMTKYIVDEGLTDEMLTADGLLNVTQADVDAFERRFSDTPFHDLTDIYFGTTSSAAVAVPEPNTLVPTLVATFVLVGITRRRRE